MKPVLLFCSLLMVSLWGKPIVGNTQNDNWNIQNSGAVTSLSSVYFIDNHTGWAVGDSGTILKTTDGGNTWNKQNAKTTNYLSSVCFVDFQTGWVVGESGTIFKTTDGGISWNTQNSGVTNHLFSVYFVDDSNGWAVGESGTILMTSDGGTTWHTQNSGTNLNLYSVHFVDHQTGYVVGGGVIGIIRSFGTPIILKTNNGGQSWISLSISKTLILYSVFFIDTQIGWIVGEEYSTPFGLEFKTPTIAMTTDGGETWTISYSSGSGELSSVYFPDNQNGWAVGTDGNILHSTDGGITWTVENSGTTLSLNCVYFVDSQTGWIAGNKGIILKYERNQSPIADANGPYWATVGIPITFDGSGSYDPDGDSLTYFWNFGDGNTATGENPTYAYADTGTYKVVLTVEDRHGGMHSDSTTAYITPDLVGLWYLNEGSGTIAEDRSRYHNHGTLYGAVSWTDGKFGKGIYFPYVASDIALNCVYILNSLPLTFSTESFTAEAWIKPISVNPTKFANILDKKNPVPAPYIGWVMAINENGNLYICAVGDSGTIAESGTTNLLDGNWHYVAMVRDTANGKFRGYVDGIEEIAVDDRVGSIYNNRPLIIGRHGNADLYHFHGTIDEIVVTKRALTAQEILDYYNSGMEHFNHRPVANANGFYMGTIGSSITFDGSSSYDTDGDSLSYSWDFGDGGKGTGMNPTHTYLESGIYTVVLSVDDARGGTDSDTTTVQIFPSGQKEISPDEHTVFLDHFNGSSLANNIYPPSSLAFTESVPGLNQAAIFEKDCIIRYDTTSWYSGNTDARGSVEALVKITTGYSHDIIVFQWYRADIPPAEGWIGRLHINDEGKLYWWVWGSGTPQGDLTGFTTLPLNEWTHIAVSWGENGTKLYVNGVVDTSSPYNICPFMHPDVHIYVGKGFGYLDELHISNIQRTDAEILFHYGLITEIEEATSINLPNAYLLRQNYPNPFLLSAQLLTTTPKTTIEYQIPETAKVTIKIFNLLGQEIRTLLDEEKEAGQFSVYWDGKDNFGKQVTSGIYIYQIRAYSVTQRNFIHTRKMLLLR